VCIEIRNRYGRIIRIRVYEIVVRTVKTGVVVIFILHSFLLNYFCVHANRSKWINRRRRYAVKWNYRLRCIYTYYACICICVLDMTLRKSLRSWNIPVSFASSRAHTSTRKFDFDQWRIYNPFLWGGGG